MKEPRFHVLNSSYERVGVCDRFRIAAAGVLLTYRSRFGAPNAWAPGTWEFVIENEDYR